MESCNFNNRDQMKSNIFLDEAGGVGISRYDHVKYPRIEKFVRKQMGFFWVPEEIDLSKDKRDFKELSESDEHIFTSNLKRQIILDSVQGRAPSLSFLPIISNPETENFVLAWSFFESIHSRSYTHIIRNVYPDPSAVFDSLYDIPEIVECAESISFHYDELNRYNAEYMNTNKITYDHKVAIWKCLNAVNALEGIRFYLSFACSWNFAQLKKMIGNANIIRLICRDENVHYAFTNYLMSVLPKDDPDFEKIKKQTHGECTKIFIDVVDQEKWWAKYLFKLGAMVGMNERVANSYIDWLSVKRMNVLGLTSPAKGIVTSNPVPWTQEWISSESVQTANQENENTSYITGGLEPDLDNLDVTKDFNLDSLIASV